MLKSKLNKDDQLFNHLIDTSTCLAEQRSDTNCWLYLYIRLFDVQYCSNDFELKALNGEIFNNVIYFTASVL